jgi:hypothetical protein
MVEPPHYCIALEPSPADSDTAIQYDPDMNSAEGPVYESRIVYNPQRIHGAAIYCSDGRVGEHFDDFLFNGLRLPRYDRVALPGGPACLAGHEQAVLERDGVADELRFLVEAHGLDRVILIAHANCAFYTQRLGIEHPEVLELRQRADLVIAAAAVRHETGFGPNQVEAYFCRPGGDRVVFERVGV